ncbi:MAG TPA: DUF882 domain-containing protein [Candidatus Binatia bacterium]|jgi:uncharacterized protein YcbK (DUF882 family)|nr:DUF882 domain-containing protein [Candidatus Binatia bacterium]
MMRVLLVVLLLVATTAAAVDRFFVMGDGTLAVTNVHNGERVTVVYRRADGTYDETQLAKLARVFRSKDDKIGDMTLRFVEVLSHVQGMTGGKPLQLLSGYRSPAYNEGLRRAGRKAASGSLHTEGMAADLAFPRPGMKDLWLALRALECCGAGYYAGNGFMHVDVGQPRFWEAATSKVDENLSGGNARVFGRTEFDHYAPGEPIALRLHAVTTPPIHVARTAKLLADGVSEGPTVQIEDIEAPNQHDGCIEVDAESRLRVVGAVAVERARVVLETCEPRVERTPTQVQSNPVSVR